MLIRIEKENQMRHLLNPLDFSVEEINQLLDLASDIEANPAKYAHVCDGKKIATLFYEPSTRTRLSFEAAMLNLGGRVLGFASADSSSASKGESVADTIRVISCFADICAMRHPKEGAPMVASLHSSIPVINAGDGGHQHPTQTLTDLMTIRSLKGRLNNLTVGLCGDLKFGRTVHSLINALSRYTGIRFVLISPPELRVPDYIIEDTLNAKGIEYKEVENLDEAMPELDILYMTRVQRERFFNEEDYIRMKDCYILDEKKMELARDDQTGSVRRIRPYGSDHDFTGGGKTMLNISGLKEGFVLDHIQAGRSMDIYFKLGLDKLDCQVAIIKNARSSKMGRKDIIKIDGSLDLVNVDVLGYIDHRITINIIKDGKIVEKKDVKMPKKITNVIHCKNPRCITSI